MKATEQGIELNRAELTALLAFTGENIPYSCVHFAVAAGSKKLAASATNGHRACDVVSQIEDDAATVGEWAVDREFLETCKRALAKGQICKLQVTPTGLKSAVIVEVESGQQRGTIGWPHDAASTQMSIEKIRSVTRIDRRLSGSWFAVNAAYLRDMALMSAACGGQPVTVYPPADSISLIFFEASGYEAQWSGFVMPVRVDAPGEREAEGSDEPREKDAIEQAFEDLADLRGLDVQKNVSVSVTVGGAEG